jgi:hypothetical protein
MQYFGGQQPAQTIANKQLIAKIRPGGSTPQKKGRKIEDNPFVWQNLPVTTIDRRI